MVTQHPRGDPELEMETGPSDFTTLGALGLGKFHMGSEGDVRCSVVQVTSQEETREDNTEAVDGQGHLFTSSALIKAGHREVPGLCVGPPRGSIVLSAQGPGLGH